MTWQDIIKRKDKDSVPKDATHLAIFYLQDPLENEYDGHFAGVGFKRHALNPIANAMKEGKSEPLKKVVKEIRQMLNEEIPDKLERDEEFTEKLESHGFSFKDINFSEAIKVALDPEIEYLSHLRRKPRNVK